MQILSVRIKENDQTQKTQLQNYLYKMNQMKKNILNEYYELIGSSNAQIYMDKFYNASSEFSNYIENSVQQGFQILKQICQKELYEDEEKSAFQQLIFLTLQKFNQDKEQVEGIHQQLNLIYQTENYLQNDQLNYEYLFQLFTLKIELLRYIYLIYVSFLDKKECKNKFLQQTERIGQVNNIYYIISINQRENIFIKQKATNLPQIQIKPKKVQKQITTQNTQQITIQTPQNSIVLNYQDYPKIQNQKQDLLLDVQKQAILKNYKFYESILDLDYKEFSNVICTMPNKIYIYNLDKLRFQSFFRQLQTRNNMIQNTIRDFQINCWKSQNIRKQLKQIKEMKLNMNVKKIKKKQFDNVKSYKLETQKVKKQEIKQEIFKQEIIINYKNDIINNQMLNEINKIQDLSISSIKPMFPQSQKNISRQTFNDSKFQNIQSSFLLQRFKRNRQINIPHQNQILIQNDNESF